MSSLRVRHLHELKFAQPDKTIVAHGVLVSFSDSEGRKVAGSLTIQRLAKLHDFPAAADASSMPPFILFGAPAEKDSAAQSNKKLVKYLSDNDQRCGVVYLDSAGTVGLLTACKKEDLKRMPQQTMGYRCYILDKTGAGGGGGGGGGGSSSSSSSAASSAPTQPNLSGNKRGSEQLAAMEHYNENLQRDRTTRHTSQIFHMRNLNNCVKATVIRLAVESQPNRPLRIIDFGCGMGGDILKWAKSCQQGGLARYVGVDIAKASLELFATERLESFRGDSCKFVSHLICADVGTESLCDADTALDTHTWVPVATAAASGSVPRAALATAQSLSRSIVGQWAATPAPLAASPQDQFDVASCQFAAHYMFQTRAKADHFFAQVSQRLRTGGVFVVTTIDCRVIAEMVAAAESGGRGDSSAAAAAAAERAKAGPGKASAERELSVKNVLGNTLLSISFSQEHWDTVLGLRPHSGPAEDEGFGVQYNFALLDSADAKAVNAPEWLIPQGPALDALAQRHGLRVRSVTNFHEFVDLHGSGRLEGSLGYLMEELGAFNYRGTMSDAEWEIARCYCVMIFEMQADKPDPGLEAILETYNAEKDAEKNKRKQDELSKPLQKPQQQAPAAAAAAPREPVSPDSPPPNFEPKSPDSSPPGPSTFQPRSPDSSPPSFKPSSPPDSPPAFAPRSPDSPPPPTFQPHSPEGSPPPAFEPRSPDSSPPSDSMATDTASASASASAASAASPEPEPEPEPQQEPEEDDDDPFTAFLLRVRKRAVERAGGSRKWDRLDDDARDLLLQTCQESLEAEGDGPM